MTVKIRAKKLLDVLESREGPVRLRKWLKKGDEQGVPKISDFSLKDLFEAFAGAHAMKALEARVTGREGFYAALGEEGVGELLEAGTPVNLTLFKNITGQLIFNEIRDAFMAEKFKISRLFRAMKSDIAGTETVPGMSEIGDKSESVGEGQEYPTAGFGEEYWTWPAGVKQGLIVDVSEEMIFFDRTGLATRRARGVGNSLGLKKEKRCIHVLIGHVNNYSRNGTATSTYLTVGAYVNASVIALVDWTDIDEAELLQNDILDPNTDEPIDIERPVLVCVPALATTARRIASATEVIFRTNPNAGTAEHETRGPTPISTKFDVVDSKQLYRQILATVQTNATKAKTWWFLLDPEAFAWKENWELQTFMQGPDGPHAFDRDVSLRVKGRYRGEAVAREPRLTFRGGDAS